MCWRRVQVGIFRLGTFCIPLFNPFVHRRNTRTVFCIQWCCRYQSVTLFQVLKFDLFDCDLSCRLPPRNLRLSEPTMVELANMLTVSEIASCCDFEKVTIWQDYSPCWAPKRRPKHAFSALVPCSLSSRRLRNRAFLLATARSCRPRRG